MTDDPLPPGSHAQAAFDRIEEMTRRRGRFAAVADDWDDPAMDIYDEDAGTDRKEMTDGARIHA